MAKIVLNDKLVVDPDLRVYESIRVTLTGLISKRTLKWVRTSKKPKGFWVQATKGATHDPGSPMKNVGDVVSFNVWKLPGMGGYKGRASFAVSAYTATGVIGAPGLLQNARVT